MYIVLYVHRKEADDAKFSLESRKQMQEMFLTYLYLQALLCNEACWMLKWAAVLSSGGVFSVDGQSVG